ncbi:MAG TPA: nitronate monooxygenase [Gemmatimonadales bacterium]|nr:nitronate monooxygenase [Gemmatimonadales bacterium]
MSTLALPAVIQGGMGIGVSNWRLARAVALRGQLGVVSGTAVDTLFVRRLQDGDAGGHLRRAMAHFPLPGVASDALKKFFLPAGRPAGAPYRMLTMYRKGASRAREQLTMLANFVEVWLAKEGHDGRVGINLLTKVQLPNLASLYGAMLAGVDCVLMGAGIPKDIPAALDAFAEGRAASMRLEVEELPAGREERVTLDPADYWEGAPPALRRPAFLAIVSSHSLATMLARKASGRVDGFVVEGPTAGGHNAPPRGGGTLNARGEPVYGERDAVDLAQLRALERPFWLAGGTGSPEGLRQALAAGAAGIQVGTLFAYADESGLDAANKRSVLAAALRGEVDVLTDPRASPTGYPFKLVRWPEDPAADAYETRERVCDIGGLRVPYVRPDGKLGYRCPAEPVAAYVEKGGRVEDTVGRRCLCNALMADVGHPQLRDGGYEEPTLVTSGDDLVGMAGFLAGRTSYTADEVLDYLGV